MTKTSFIHITDLHITSTKLDEEHVYSDTKKNLEITKEIIRGIKDTPKFILISGDLTNSGDKESFVTLREMMEEIDIPKFYTLGNHDTREGYYKGFLQEESKDSYVDYETVIENIHLIVLDTSRTHVVGGVLDESQFDFLTESLNKNPELKKIIMFHHPPMLEKTEDFAFECLNWEHTLKIEKILKGFNIAGIFCGHIHQDRVSDWNGIPIIVGNGNHTMMDIFYEGKGLRMKSGTSIGLCTLRDSGLTVNFYPLPSDRIKVGEVSIDRIKEYEASRAKIFRNKDNLN